MWCVYFLQLGNGDVYVGSTNDLRRRIDSHGRGDVASTKAYLPAALKSYVAVETEKVARELERYFKSGSGKAFANKRLWRNERESARRLARLGGSEPKLTPSPRAAIGAEVILVDTSGVDHLRAGDEALATCSIEQRF